MLDTIYPKYADKLLMTRFAEPSFKEYAVIDGPCFIFKNLKKAYYGEFYFHCIENKNGVIKAILHAEINQMGEYLFKQYVIWELKDGHIMAATLLNGDEDFKL